MKILFAVMYVAGTNFVVNYLYWMAMLMEMMMTMNALYCMDSLAYLDPIFKMKKKNNLFIEKYWLVIKCLTEKPTFISRTCNFSFSKTSLCGRFGTPIKLLNIPNGWLRPYGWLYWILLNLNLININWVLFLKFTLNVDSVQCAVMNFYHNPNHLYDRYHLNVHYLR